MTQKNLETAWRDLETKHARGSLEWHRAARALVHAEEDGYVPEENYSAPWGDFLAAWKSEAKDLADEVKAMRPGVQWGPV